MSFGSSSPRRRPHLRNADTEFNVRETENEFRISMDSLDGSTHVLVDGHTTSNLPLNSVFASVAEVSRFFEAGSLGYSPDG